MRVVCISDTHEFHREVEVPDGDMLIHAGDFTHLSDPLALHDFNKWLGDLPHAYKIVVPGNHDGLLEEPEEREIITNAKLLVNSRVKIQGVRIWGSPVTSLPGQPFGVPKNTDRKKLWAQIPDDTNILVTHSPAFGILDTEVGSTVHQGCPELLAAIKRVQPRLHVCGHVHGGYGIYRSGHTMHVNAALYDELGGMERQPIVFEF